MSKISTFEIIQRACAQQGLIPQKCTVLVAFSGGADSVFLLHALAKLRETIGIKKLYAAHLDHGWRTESTADALWCKNHAEQLGIQCIIGHAHEFNHMVKKNGSLEDTGRQLRRAFLQKIAHNCGAERIALAHHADDQSETFFIRLARGSSLTGLAGMSPQEGLFIRPLLELSKSDILAYLTQNGISWKEDFTNTSHNFLRNRIRLIGIPALKACDARFSTTILSTMQGLREADDFIEELVKATFQEISIAINQELCALDQSKFCALQQYLQKKIILAWLIKSGVSFNPSRSLFLEIIRFIKHGNGSSHSFGSWKIHRNKNRLWIEKKS